MDKLHESLLLEILSRLDDSSDVARCRVASKAFDAVFPGLRSVNLWYECINSRSRDSTSIKKIFLDLILKLETVESVSMDVLGDYDFILMDFATDWMPRVARSLKSLSMHGFHYWGLKSNVLLLISAYSAMRNLNPMRMLTSFTLHQMYLDDAILNELNTCFPNLQVLNLRVSGFKDPKIHHLNLQVSHWDFFNGSPSSLTLITPNLITLKIECHYYGAIHVEAPVLSHFHLRLDSVNGCIGSLLLEFPITKTLETLTLCSRYAIPGHASDSKLTLAKVFMLFPDVSSLRFNPDAFSILEACMNLEGYEILDQCVSLSKLSLLIHSDVSVTRLESFMSKCTARRPWLKWRWGRWKEHREDSWITDGKPTKYLRSATVMRMIYESPFPASKFTLMFVYAVHDIGLVFFICLIWWFLVFRMLHLFLCIRLAMIASEKLLIMQPHNCAIRRDHGMMLISLGIKKVCYLASAIVISSVNNCYTKYIPSL
ncbi:F-box/LRR-repeat protein At4g29420-like [Bidens hawaiensis]|uniref:F-box/LRR-repeat protein At4g29420-like n=1 Tax=Bidens hawaiensis TaxID=980011 RepID=UPI00404916BE